MDSFDVFKESGQFNKDGIDAFVSNPMELRIESPLSLSGSMTNFKMINRVPGYLPILKSAASWELQKRELVGKERARRGAR